MMLIQTPAQMILASRARAARGAQRGVTMIELTVVLVIAGLLAAAVFLGFQANSRRTAVANNTAQVTETAAELKKKFGITNQYGALTTALAVQSRVIPESLRLTPTTAQNSYGGLITVAPVTLVSANDAALLTWPTVPQNQCMDLVIAVSDVARRITVNGVVVKPTDQALNIGTLATNCELIATPTVLFAVGRS